jgi:cytochrome P450
LTAGPTLTNNANKRRATYPEEEAKVVREIEEKLPGGMRPTLAAINDVRFIYLFYFYLLLADSAMFVLQLERLDLFVKETMRLFPAAAQLADRVTRTATTIGRYPIPAGVPMLSSPPAPNLFFSIFTHFSLIINGAGIRRDMALPAAPGPEPVERSRGT